MTQLSIKGKEILLVEVIADVNLRVYNGKLKYGGNRGGLFILDLPPGNWRILGSGKAGEITGDQWKDVVDSIWNETIYYKNYNEDDLWYFMPTESGHSLLSHHGYEVNRTVILIKE